MGVDGSKLLLTNSAEAAAMRALLAQWRMDVRWCRGGLPPTGVVPPLLLLPGGVSGSSPPLMAPALRYSVRDERGSTGKRKHFRNETEARVLHRLPPSLVREERLAI